VGHLAINFNSLYPELLVECLARSRFFYEEILGFVVEYERPEEHFLYLSLNGGAQIMLLQDNGNHHSQTGPMHYPRGQGVNFSILCDDLAPVLEALAAHEIQPRIPVRDQWHRQDNIEHGEKQLWVMDPDGYLLRLIQKLGTRRCQDTG